MRNGLLSAVGACAILTGFAHAWAPESGPNPNAASRPAPTAVTPAAESAAPNDCRLARANPPLAQLSQITLPEANQRLGYSQAPSYPQITARSLSLPAAPARDSEMFKVRPGDKANKLPERALERNLTPPVEERKISPPADVVTPRGLSGITPHERFRDR